VALSFCECVKNFELDLFSGHERGDYTSFA